MKFTWALLAKTFPIANMKHFKNIQNMLRDVPKISRKFRKKCGEFFLVKLKKQEPK